MIVLIHGIGMYHRYFQRLGDQLSAHGPVVLLDLSGSGSTKTPTAGMTNAAKAESVGALLAEIGGANHSVHRSASEAVTARILIFLTGTAHHLEERRTA
ncbi:alpha/beta fold hydrolase [Arthrobacter sp. TMN-37]